MRNFFNKYTDFEIAVFSAVFGVVGSLICVGFDMYWAYLDFQSNGHKYLWIIFGGLGLSIPVFLINAWLMIEAFHKHHETGKKLSIDEVDLRIALMKLELKDKHSHSHRIKKIHFPD